MNRYSASPPFPARIPRLGELATDLWWSWNGPARNVFRTLDYALWRATAHNPVRMLWTVSPAVLQRAANDPVFLSTYDAAIAALEASRDTRNTWWATAYPSLAGRSLAYFSAEFALHQ